MNRDRTQPVETIGKVVKYMCGGRWHHPFFADNLNWATMGMISQSGVIQEYEIVRCSKPVLEKLKSDLAFSVVTRQLLK